MRPSLLTLARRALTDDAKITPGSTVVAAVSGGPDSMALLHVLARLRAKLGLVVHAHGVDHGLRAEARSELDGAERFAEDLEVPFARTIQHVAPGGNLQARARTARYAALADAAIALGARTIATAHHADDRAETVLLRLLRGAGPRGLAVLPVRTTVRGGLEVVRPLVRVRRAEIVAHLERHGVRYATDPSNENPRYLRTRVRRDLMPLLAQLSPGIVDHLLALADQLGTLHGGPPTDFPLPRSTQAALVDLLRSRSATARVWLPGGLVVSLDPRARPGPCRPSG